MQSIGMNLVALSMQLNKSLNRTPGWKLNLQAMEKNDFSAWLIRPQPAGPSVSCQLLSVECLVYK